MAAIHGVAKSRTRLSDWTEGKVLVAQSCSLFATPRTSPPVFIHGISQARILESVAVPFSRGSSWPWDWTQVSCIPDECFTIRATREALTAYFLDWNFPLFPSSLTLPDYVSQLTTSLQSLLMLICMFLKMYCTLYERDLQSSVLRSHLANLCGYSP